MKNKLRRGLKIGLGRTRAKQGSPSELPGANRMTCYFNHTEIFMSYHPPLPSSARGLSKYSTVFGCVLFGLFWVARRAATRRKTSGHFICTRSLPGYPAKFALVSSGHGSRETGRDRARPGQSGLTRYK